MPYINDTIHNSVFQYIRSTDKGGSISLKNFSLNLICCNFYVCSSTNQGGVIYFENCQVNLSNNFFEKCCSLVKVDENFGNILYSVNSTIKYEYNTASRCGPSASECSDSALAFANMSVNISNINMSFGSDYNGGALCNLMGKTQGSIIEYSQVLHPYGDHNMMELRDCEALVNFVNFVNDTGCRYMFNAWLNFTLNSCILIDCSKGNARQNIVITFVDCYTNKPYRNYELSETSWYTDLSFVNQACSVDIGKYRMKCTIMDRHFRYDIPSTFLYVFIML